MSRHRITGGLEAVIAHARARGWTDGLPIVPPTEARVRRVLAADPRPPGTVIAAMAPAMGEATLELLAVNLVMAGGGPELLAPLAAAVEALAAPEFNLLGVQATTNPVAPLVVVNGPARSRLGFHGGANALGQGAAANVLLGRAVRLVLVNIGGGRPGEADRATLGQPGKLAFCLAENEEASPWPPLHAERGCAATDSAVTVLAPSGTTNVIDRGSRTAGELLTTLAGSMRVLGSNNYTFGGGPAVVLSPEHAALLGAAGLARPEVKRRLFEATAVPLSAFPEPNRAAVLERAVVRAAAAGREAADVPVPLADGPDDIVVLVAGGAGRHSVVLPTFGDSRPVTRRFTAVEWAAVPAGTDDPAETAGTTEILLPVPVAAAGRGATLAAGRPLRGAVLGLLDNAKPNADRLLTAVGAALRARHGVGRLVTARKPLSTSAADEALLARLAAECDVVVTAAAD